MTKEISTEINPVIRPMRREDIDLIVSLEKSIFSDPWPAEAFTEEADNSGHIFLIAEFEHEIVGYASYYIEMGEGRITNLAVVPKYRRKAVAKKLLEYILGLVKMAKCKYIFLDVRPSNEAAIALYCKYKFYEVYRRPKYYQNPDEEAMVMVKNLDDE